MFSRAARKLADNLNKKKVLRSDCTFFFARLECHVDAYVKGATSVGTGRLSRICNPPTPVRNNHRESRYKDCTEGHASKKARTERAE